MRKDKTSQARVAEHNDAGGSAKHDTGAHKQSEGSEGGLIGEPVACEASAVEAQVVEKALRGTESDQDAGEGVAEGLVAFSFSDGTDGHLLLLF
jgi:hypothetical protein